MPSGVMNLLMSENMISCDVGEEGNVKAAQDALLKRAKANSMAQLGK
jgi:fructose-bisphosphate aldolase class 1